MTTPTKIEVRMWWTPLMSFYLASGEFEIHNGDPKPSIVQIENFKDHINEGHLIQKHMVLVDVQHS